jgi:hypothetical protein
MKNKNKTKIDRTKQYYYSNTIESRNTQLKKLTKYHHRAKQMSQSSEPIAHSPSITSLPSNFDKSLITCAICTDLLSDPVDLTCGHTFCYQCILEWEKSDALVKMILQINQ